MIMRLTLATSAVVLIATSAGAQEAKPRSVAPPLMQRWTPTLADFTDRVLFGDVWRRSELGPRDRSLVTVAALIATGKTAQLEGHLGRALDNGVRPGEIAGLVTHLAFYSGWPSAVSSLEVVDRVFRARGVDPASVRTSAAPLPVPASEATRKSMVDASVAPNAPKLAALTNDVLFADLWRRPDLAARDRSLVTIAALGAAGDADQLTFHIQRGIENGLTPQQVNEALTHLAFYAGWPKAMAAVAVAAKATAHSPEAPASGEALRVIPPAAEPRQGPSKNFTGRVTVTSAFNGSGGARLGGATVSFQPGARSNWHTHPLGQLLVVTEGEGLVQVQGGQVRKIRRGDTVWTAPGVKHWHGASASRGMTHVGVSESAPGQNVAWLEPVSDAVYQQPPASSD
ncbi:carboxymuconolactone decarboxylase family protein [Sphingomonas phyllosphaerae]|uniref:(R)-mandelonitrile lyase n=1 Tax=Sphingomonas phyllosphaerae TaxID=257003 RepID=UPI001EE29B83|nr:carboxymuconolactone decarboxylase family protein [Sphingomonas phyllosphaerae]